MRFAQRAVTLLAVATIAAFAGCGKQAEEEPAVAQPDITTTDETAPATPEATAAAPGQEVLPGESSVRSAFARKEYDTAVGALLALRNAAATPEQNQAYMVLYDEVKFGLMDASQTDRKAANALAMLRASSAGR